MYFNIPSDVHFVLVERFMCRLNRGATVFCHATLKSAKTDLVFEIHQKIESWDFVAYQKLLRL